MSATRRLIAFGAGLVAVFAAAFGAGAALGAGDGTGDADPAHEAPDHTGTEHEGAG